MFVTSARVVIFAVLVAVASTVAAAPHRRHRERKHQRARAPVSTPFALASPSPEPPAPATAMHARLELTAAAAPPDDASAPPPPPAIVAPPAVAPPAHRDDVGRQRAWGLFGGGLALFVGGYALDVGLSYGLGHQPAATSLIPIVGPLVQMGDSWAMVAPAQSGNPEVDGPANERIASVNHAIQTAAYAVLGVDFALQLAGATMAVVGVVGHAPRRYAAGSGTRVAWTLRHDGVAVRF